MGRTKNTDDDEGEVCKSIGYAIGSHDEGRGNGGVVHSNMTIAI